eukprot:2314538-Prymnesium_polylepis.1
MHATTEPCKSRVVRGPSSVLRSVSKSNRGMPVRRTRTSSAHGVSTNGPTLQAQKPSRRRPAEVARRHPTRCSAPRCVAAQQWVIPFKGRAYVPTSRQVPFTSRMRNHP